MNNESRVMNKGKIANFTDLNAWQEAHKLALAIYEVSRDFPKDELFGLTSQMRRAAVSVTSNIAEGFSRNSNDDKIHFYTMAIGSLTEIQSQLFLASDTGYLTKGKFDKVFDQSVTAHKLLNGLKKSTKERISR
jgi:four helix bundle protein